ncbi:MAG: hypothetical protein OEQ28_09380 [Acidobacteriota bacterium]|nr:hypothetical protein [Acidobacteriota bacterium]
MELAAIIFVFVVLFIAYVVFRVLKKTVKMAIRALIVLVLITLALVGGAALWSVNGSERSLDLPTETL